MQKRVQHPYMRAMVAGILLLSFGSRYAYSETVKRGRHEGTLSIAPSNVQGNGNITVFGHLGGVLTPDALGGDSRIGASMGLAELLQFQGSVSFVDFRQIGTSQLHLQITTPGNDRLRFFGAALAADLYLTAALDTLSLDADSTRPFYSPFILPSGVIDFDFLGVAETVPLKVYLKTALAPRPELLYRYSQLSFATGLEWKLYEHGLFIETAMALFKEKANKIQRETDNSYRQRYLTITPGGRFRIQERFSLVGGVGITVFKTVKNEHALQHTRFALSVRFEAPVVFKETNAEAIRTLVFQKQMKQELMNEAELAERMKQEESLLSDFDATLEELGDGEESFDYSREQEKLMEKRKEIQQTMDEIEQLLRETE